NVPLGTTVGGCLLLIWLYTKKGGLKTIIITGMFQTFCLVLAVVLSIYFMADGLGISVMEAFERVKDSTYSQVVVWEDLLGDRNLFWKHLICRAFVTITMIGLDQDLMQINLSMKTIGE